MEALGEISRPANAGSVNDFAEFVSEHLKDSGFSDQRTQEVVLSMKEALGNILRFSCSGGDYIIEIACSLDNMGKLVITINDNGKPFNMLIESDPFLTPDDALTTDERPSTKIMKRSVGNIECKRYEDKNITTFTLQPPAGP
ncbi:MAG TPA: ATP-binding protein [Syntrophorhabdaceae bacterium]|nr:ATP-binding protein [Syntrophorhabdaceae bacterium]HQM80492.1 ATP-binding protein [Syntrophorhabdaceae bacterium]